MTTEHLCFRRRPSSRTRVFKILESLSKSDSFLNQKLIVTGATHIKKSQFMKSCEENDARIFSQSKIKTSFILKILPVPKPIIFVISIYGRQLISFIQSIDHFLIAKIFAVSDDDYNTIMHTLCNSDYPISEEDFGIKANFFIYGFDFDVQDPDNPVEELYSYSLIPNDLRLFFE